MAIPQDLKYTEEHEWIRVTDDIATVGITDYAQDQLGDVVYVDLPSSGTSLTQFGKLGEIESVKAVSDIYAPLTVALWCIRQCTARFITASSFSGCGGWGLG